MNSLTVTLSNKKEITISQLPLGKFSDLMKAIKELPNHFGDLAGITNEQLMVKLPELIGNALPDTIRILHIATPLTEEELTNNISLDDAVTLFIAVIEVNQFKEIYERLKKTFTQPIKNVPAK